jgi:hypothetical protein
MNAKSLDCFPSLSTLTDRTGYSRPTITNALKAAQKAGFISWKKGCSKAHRSNTYSATIPVENPSEELVELPSELVEIMAEIEAGQIDLNDPSWLNHFTSLVKSFNQPYANHFTSLVKSFNTNKSYNKNIITRHRTNSSSEHDLHDATMPELVKENSVVTDVPQSDSKEPTIPDEAVIHSVSGNRVYWGTDIDLRAARHFYESIKRIDPNKKEPNFSKWANEIRLMHCNDGRDYREIRDVFDWANQDDFWSSNILSPTKLRKQFTQLVARKKSTKGSSRPAKTRRNPTGVVI